jgi:2-oxoglutarate dehydrogenase E1 component
MAHRTTLEADRGTKPTKSSKKAANGADRERTFEAFRRWGYLQANLDPLGFLKPLDSPDLDFSGEIADEARRLYCGTIGVDFMHLAQAERRNWIAERMEAEPEAVDQQKILERLVRADLFEQVLQARYLGTKRFSLEGNTSLIPMLDAMLDMAGEHGAVECVMAMSHRGRLSVMVHTACKTPHEVVAGFEDVDPRSVLGAGDVKYHVGATGVYVTNTGKEIEIHLVSNPSHLEAVDPVAMGRVRAKLTRFEGGFDRDVTNKVVPIIMHGDAAFAGQGIWAETMNLADLDAYTVGGSIHIIVNNLIGFTTRPIQEHSSRFAADLAKRQNIPVFHVNAEDPDAVVRVGRMAAEYRATFGSDVVVDLIGYRRHGHSEVDDPTITQPLLYERIKTHPQLWKIYAEKTGINATATLEAVRAEYETEQVKAGQLKKIPHLRQLPKYWSAFHRGAFKPEYEVETGLSLEKLATLTSELVRVPEGFHTHAKIVKLLEQRSEMGNGKRAVDYGFAETLAFGSLLQEGTPLRLTGQDTQRGTFNQRHAVLVDTVNEWEHVPLAAIAKTASSKPFCEIHNSSLSEAGCLGFEYGFSRDFPEALVLWEAQFGDFANGAQVLIDQFLSSSEDKWYRLSGLVLLLPHGFEGQGPEHSSARLERFLTLCAEDNMQVCNLTTPAQCFHALRRSVVRRYRKPLVIMSPKSLLRSPAAVSSLDDLATGEFQRIIPDVANLDPKKVKRVLLCSGKVYYDLAHARTDRKRDDLAIVRVEQL